MIGEPRVIAYSTVAAEDVDDIREALARSESAVALSYSDSVREFIRSCGNVGGEPVYIVKGAVRRVRWKSAGLGFAKVWTEGMQSSKEKGAAA